jgi:uncharacterized protein YbjQ (UPF0145 family)
MIISTTNTIEGATIEKYISLVSTNVVVGANIFSDIAASFTDFFGGNSGTYQRKLQGIYDESYKQLSKKAKSIGANAIIGVRIDFDEISGKNKSMFMVSATGTAVVLSLSTNMPENDSESVTSYRLKVADQKQLIKGKIHNKEILSDEDWDFLAINDCGDLSAEIFEYTNSINFNLTADFDKYFSYLSNYIQSVDTSIITPIIYRHIKTHKKFYIEIIKHNELFDVDQLRLMIVGNDIATACDLFSAYKRDYTRSEVEGMRFIIQSISGRPRLGKIASIKSGVFSRMEEKYVCPEGHINNKDKQYCSECGQDIYGLTKDNRDAIELLEKRANLLSELLRKS